MISEMPADLNLNALIDPNALFFVGLLFYALAMILIVWLVVHRHRPQVHTEFRSTKRNYGISGRRTQRQQSGIKQ